jgi:hypothetical protein
MKEIPSARLSKSSDEMTFSNSNSNSTASLGTRDTHSSEMAFGQDNVNFMNFLNTHNVVGPMRLRILKHLEFASSTSSSTKKIFKKASEESEMDKKNVKNEHLLLMDRRRMSHASEGNEHSQETLECERADRAEFVRCLMLSMMQDEKFQL